MRDYENTPAFAYFSYYEHNFTTAIRSRQPTTWFLGVYDPELEQQAVFGELGFDVTENFTITAGGRWFDYDRRSTCTRNRRPASAAARCSTPTSSRTRTARVWQAQYVVPL